VVGIQRPIYGSEGLVDPTCNSTFFLTTFKGSWPSIISASSSQSASTSQSASSSQSAQTIRSAGRGKNSHPEHSRASARAPCTLTHSCMVQYISSHKFSLDQKPQITQSCDRNKFSPLESPYAPYPIPAWSAALQAVDQSSSNLVEASKTSQSYGHYAFPDPGLFIHPATAAKYIGSWLQVRDAWFMRMAKESSLALSNQSWRTLLAIDHSVVEKGETKAARRRQEALDMLLPSAGMYSGVERRIGLMGPIVWQGKEYPSGVLPPESVVREILWELYELNFIYELQSLDRRACQNLDLSSATQLFERQIEISQCFRTSSFRNVSIPSENSGLADDDFDKRFCFVTGLVFVMRSWKGEKPSILVIDPDDAQLTPDGAKETEKVIARYYCQQFFNYFGRAAQVPHRLFATNSS
jgi:hypothetical protein